MVPAARHAGGRTGPADDGLRYRSGSQISRVPGAGAGSKVRKSWIAQPRPSRPASRAAAAASSA